jgi:hypothetical protein
MRFPSTITYASLLSLVSAACGGVTVVEVVRGDDAGASASSTCPEDASATADAGDGGTIEDAGVDAFVGCPGPTDPRWEAGTVPPGCGILGDGGSCYGPTLVTPELACAIRTDYRVCQAMQVCGTCAAGCNLPYLGVDDGGADAGNCGFGTTPVTVSCFQAGRRPQGLEAHGGMDRDALARFFSETAWLEAASVVAFERLALELRAFGAPAALVRDCERAAIEEAEHATAVGAIATRYGAELVAPCVDAFRARSLFDLARENVVEGCVKETFAAAVAVVQSLRAGDRDLRQVMKKIATEEASHADLSRRIDLWARTRLGPEEIEALDAAASEAAESLARTLPDANDDERLRRIAGLPSSVESTRILAKLRCA